MCHAPPAAAPADGSGSCFACTQTIFSNATERSANQLLDATVQIPTPKSQMLSHLDYAYHSIMISTLVNDANMISTRVYNGYAK
jgi:hypothetical protein